MLCLSQYVRAQSCLLYRERSPFWLGVPLWVVSTFPLSEATVVYRMDPLFSCNVQSINGWPEGDIKPFLESLCDGMRIPASLEDLTGEQLCFVDLTKCGLQRIFLRKLQVKIHEKKFSIAHDSLLNFAASEDSLHLFTKMFNVL